MIHDARSYRVAKIDTDHILVIAKLQTIMTLKRKSQMNNRRKFYVENMKKRKGIYADEVSQQLKWITSIEVLKKNGIP